MRIAYLTARLPFPPVGGDRMRVYYTLRHLLRSYEVTLYTMASGVRLSMDASRSELPGLRQKIFSMGKSAYAWNGTKAALSELPLQVKLYECPALARTLNEDIRNGEVDLLFVHLVRMAEYVRQYDDLPRILDMADSIYLHYTRMPRIWWSPRWAGARLDMNRMRRYEAAVTAWFDKVLVHTDEDLGWVRKESGASNLLQSQMGVDTDEFAFHDGPYDPHRIVYCGKLDYLPNTDAVTYFAGQIFPLIRQQVSDAQFSIVGFNPPRTVRALAQMPGIQVRANVPDVRPEVAGAAVSVAPLRFGAGIQNKILQSLALGVPVVASPLVAMPFREGNSSPVLEAQSPRDFANHVVRVLLDSEYRSRLARTGRKLVEEHFQWEQVMASLDRVLEAASGRKVQTVAGAPR